MLMVAHTMGSGWTARCMGRASSCTPMATSAFMTYTNKHSTCAWVVKKLLRCQLLFLPEYYNDNSNDKFRLDLFQHDIPPYSANCRILYFSRHLYLWLSFSSVHVSDMRVISRTTWRGDTGSCSISMERSMRCDDACVLLPLLSVVSRLSVFHWSTILCHWSHYLLCTLYFTCIGGILSPLQHCYTLKLLHHNIQ